MNTLTNIFVQGCKVVISPDKMRAWISLIKPDKGVAYTAQAVKEWLPENGVVFGADDEMIRQAVSSERYDDLLEVARAQAAVAAAGGDYVLKVEKKPFTGLRAGSDGALLYDDLSFLQEVQAGQILAEILPAVPAQTGMTVTGEAVAPREGSPGRTLSGSGFTLADDGRTYTAPGLSHVSILNEELVVTPLTHLENVTAEDGPLDIIGNVLVRGDVMPTASLTASGSIFVEGRAISAFIKSGNNVLLCQGMRSEGGYGTVTAKGHVWGMFFESCNITASGDIYANHLIGCEVHVNGRANILGGRALVSATHLYAQNGVVAGKLGDGTRDTEVVAGLEQSFLGQYNTIQTKINRLGVDIQALQQTITTHERVNKMKPDKGRADGAYKDMVARRNQSLSVLNILNKERTRMKRTVDQFSTVAIIARDVANPGVTIIIDNRSLKITTPMKRTKFRRDNEIISSIAAQNR